eukprot:Gregarina_sp_Poly_1__10819@NODE_835_length_6073_cov_244_613387_g603_i0_p5_GENE_NODE_835_length_6073_cov_244_613387_g603_i0NODE_835_length_6073_cov_244_613387_g603_i0_p5_ORF_typecomplete_len246_score32_35Proteasome/PF00227_26/1_6e34CbiG_N/PF11760_8/2_5e03CbiG_N/PF11760_8/0_27_NODE_835_length_6073_cov_244_613387_g603_i014042141
MSGGGSLAMSLLPPHPMHKFDDSPGSRHAEPHTIPSTWSPYVDNGGSFCAVAGNDFAVIAADTRTSQGYSILSRMQPKWIQLTKTTVLCSAGMRADIQGLWNVLKWYVAEYTFQHKHEPSVEALAQQLSVLLYQRRFFPFYTFNILVGVTAAGSGVLYSYDAVGSHELVYYGAAGAAAEMLLPVLDNKFEDPDRAAQVSVSECVDICYAALRAATEREITTGDSADIVIVTKDGVSITNKPLNKD